MKSSLFVICALFASVSAIKGIPEKPSYRIEDGVNLQVGVEAQARSNVREMLKANLRSALENGAQLGDESLIQLEDDDLPSVADARVQAAQMQA